MGVVRPLFSKLEREMNQIGHINKIIDLETIFPGSHLGEYWCIITELPSRHTFSLPDWPKLPPLLFYSSRESLWEASVHSMYSTLEISSMDLQKSL